MIIVRSWILLSIGILLSISLKAQPSSDESSNSVDEDFSMQDISERWASMQGGAILPESGVFPVSKRKASLKGNFYLTEDYLDTQIWLKDGSALSGIPAKYNLLTNIFIFSANDGNLKGMLGARIDRFQFKDPEKGVRRFVNVSNYPSKPLEYLGFYEILTDGETKLLSKQTAGIFRPTYFIALDIGEKSAKVYFRNTFYLYLDNNVTILKGITGKDLQVFGDYKTQMKRFVKENKLKFRNVDDLARLVTHYNSLTSSKLQTNEQIHN